MAVFMINICKYNSCGITFPRLADLIEHIEDVHIDTDPAVIEQKEASQPACISLSYILRFITEATRREIHNEPPVPDVRRRLLSAPKTPSVRSSTPTGSELDEEEVLTPSDDSNDSWTTVEEYSSEFILRYGVKMNANASSGALGPAAQEKPFACPVPGCKKRYKNVNGIKYHSKNGHKKDGKVKKAYKCHCGKSYKTALGLKSHSIAHHISSSAPVAAAALRALASPRPAGLVVTASPAPATAATSATPARSLALIDGVDGNKLVRIYDTIRTRDLPAFTVPKHNLAGVNIVGGGPSRQAGVPTPASAPGPGLPDGMRFERSPRVTVQTAQTVRVVSYPPDAQN